MKYKYAFVDMDGTKQSLCFLCFSEQEVTPGVTTFSSPLGTMDPLVRNYQETFIIKISMILFMTT